MFDNRPAHPDTLSISRGSPLISCLHRVPRLDPDCKPPVILGAAALATAMMHGASADTLSAIVDQRDADPAARLFDRAILCQLVFNRDQGIALQDTAIAAAPVLRVARAGHGRAPIRLLALMSPGDMMANTPLDFITRHLDVQLDLLFLVPGQDLPATMPDHDLMFFAAAEPDAATLRRMETLYHTWPRPVLNDPGVLPSLSRARLPELLAGRAELCSPAAVVVDDCMLDRVVRGEAEIADILPNEDYPILVRPVGSHAGIGLEKIEDVLDLADYAQRHGEAAYTLTPFVDYAGADGLFRKARIAFVDGQPHLCHMATSQRWMVHYLNAGMDQDAGKREDEARAMDAFSTGFAVRHRAAFDALIAALPFDYFSIDCAELPDGRLLVFEVDTAAIVHLMDAETMYPYKHVHMHRMFEAFDAMLHRAAGA